MKIKAAALRHAGITYWMPAPARHGHVIHAFAANKGERVGARMEQGFILQDDSFVDRITAAALFEESGGVLKWPPNLYSEDLW